MKLLISLFLTPILEKGILSANEVQRLFSNISSLIKINEGEIFNLCSMIMLIQPRSRREVWKEKRGNFECRESIVVYVFGWPLFRNCMINRHLFFFISSSSIFLCFFWCFRVLFSKLQRILLFFFVFVRFAVHFGVDCVFF